MKPHFPQRYSSTITRVDHGLATIDAPPRPRMLGGPPPVLHGDPVTWSPEHMLVAALGLCLFTTFDVFAAREHINVHEWRDTVTGVLDKKPSGLAFQSFTIQVDVTVDPADAERARAALDRACLYSVVAKALDVPVKVVPHIHVRDERAHASVA